VNVEPPLEPLLPAAHEVGIAGASSQGEILPVLSDTERTLERYKKAIEQIKKALELRRDEWEHFELSGFDSLTSVGEGDLKTLQLQIDRVLDSRNKAAQNRTTWQKSKHIVEQVFMALAPCMKIIFSLAQQSAQVISLPEGSK
jgi:hypothetical protein